MVMVEPSFFLFWSPTQFDCSSRKVTPGHPGRGHDWAAVPGDREAQAYHSLVPSRQGGRDAGRGDADGELRWDPEDSERVQGDDGNLQVPDQPIQRV